MIIVDSKQSNIRIDKFIANNSDLTRSHISKLIDGALVLVNGETVKSSYIVKVGDKIEYSVPEPTETDISPKNIPIEIIYQDDDLAVINKQQGLTVHPGNGTDGNTLVNALLFHLDNLSGINGELRPGIVHRIDKNTSGLLVVAKNDNAHLSLAKQIENKTCKRTYLALLVGNVKEDEGIIKTYIERDKKDRTKMTVSTVGRYAETHYKVIKRYVDYTLCEFTLQTGRTHQIRVHCKYVLHHSIVGDREYGIKDKFNLNGQLLHAYKIEFVHPTKNELMTFTAPLPVYFSDVLNKLKILC